MATEFCNIRVVCIDSMWCCGFGDVVRGATKFSHQRGSGIGSGEFCEAGNEVGHLLAFGIWFELL
jgi:hypothetical protein